MVFNSRSTATSWTRTAVFDLEKQSKHSFLIRINFQKAKFSETGNFKLRNVVPFGGGSLASRLPKFRCSDKVYMFTNSQRQVERAGKYGTPRMQYLQELVIQFQNASAEETKEKIVANLADFAYDPFNFTFLRQLNVIELFLDCLTEPSERLVKFGIGGICNACADPANAARHSK